MSIMHLRTLLLIIAVSAVAGAVSLGTDFTYQGNLSDAGVPAEGDFDFRFLLYDTDVGGSQVGSTLLVGDLPVSNGKVMTQLDFGSVFDGAALWLEIHVRDGISTGAYSILSPRQELTSSPYAQLALQAQHATTADSASTAGSASQLDGQAPAYYLAWANLTGVPTGLDDGDDDTLDSLSCSADEIAKWNGSAWNCASDDGAYVRTYVVGPVGTAAENGAALLAAHAAIPYPASQEGAALLRIEPGLYDLATSYLPMKQFVDIEGSGRGVTKITSAYCSSAIGTVNGAAYAELRYLTVENTCSGAWGIGIYSNSDGTRLTGLTVHVSGATTSNGVRCSGSSVVMTDLDVTVTGTTTANGVRSDGDWGVMSDLKVTLTPTETGKGVYSQGDSTVMTDLDVQVTGGSGGSTCVENLGDSVRMHRLWLTATGGNSSVIGVRNDGISVTMTEINAEVSGDAPTYGVIDFGSDVSLRDSVLTASGGASIVRGLYSTMGGDLELVNVIAKGDTEAILLYSYSGISAATLTGVTASGPGVGLYTGVDADTLTVTCDQCRIHGDSYSVRDGGGAIINIGSSQVSGGNTGASSLTCAGVYDENYVFYASSCP